jgi:hypothetical protein
MIHPIKYQIAKDTNPERLAMISSLREERFFLRAALNILDNPRFIGLKMFASFVYAFLRIPNLSNHRKKKVLAIAWSENEEKIIEEFFRDIGFSDFGMISLKYGIPPIFWFCRCVFQKKIIKVLSIIKKMNRKYSFPISARVVEVLLLYFYFSSHSGMGKNQRVFLSTTQSHPHFSVLSSLAKKKKVKLIFLAHSPCVAGPLPIFSNLGVFWGFEGAKQFERIGSMLLAKQYYFPPKRYPIIDKERVVSKNSILISLSKNPNWLDVTELIHKLQRHFPKHNLKIRAHPNSLSKFPIGLKIFLTGGKSLAVDLLDADFMIAGNSTVHLEAFLHGIPSYLATTIDDRPGELLGFLRLEEIQEVDRLWEKSNNGVFNDSYPAKKYEEIQKKYFSDEISPQIVHAICELTDGITSLPSS